MLAGAEEDLVVRDQEHAVDPVTDRAVHLADPAGDGVEAPIRLDEVPGAAGECRGGCVPEAGAVPGAAAAVEAVATVEVAGEAVARRDRAQLGERVAGEVAAAAD